VLRFTCPHCSVKLTAREERAGKNVLCPRCKGKIAIPHPPEPEPPALQLQDDLQLVDSPKPLDGALLQLKDEPQRRDAAVDERRREEELRSSILPPSSPECTGERTLPWPIDILLYPFSAAGLTTLAIVIVIPLLISLAVAALGPLGFFIALPGGIVNAVISAYFLWYVTRCVQDSGLGGVRAPETISQAPGLWEMAEQLGRTLACFAVALLPLMIYWGRVLTVDATYWSLLAFAAAVFPMAMLSVTMHDSIGGLNPLILIPSVFRTLLSYIVLVVVLGSLVFLLVRIRLAIAEDPSLCFAFSIAQCYPILVAAHLLGRFYWRCSEKLDWLV
jgi:hypothetical protein